MTHEQLQFQGKILEFLRNFKGLDGKKKIPSHKEIGSWLYSFYEEKLDTYADAKYKEEIKKLTYNAIQQGWDEAQEAFDAKLAEVVEETEKLKIENPKGIVKQLFSFFRDNKERREWIEIAKSHSNIDVGYNQGLSDSASIIRSKMSKNV